MANAHGQMVSIPPISAQFSEADEMTEEDGCWTELQLAAKDGDIAKARALIDSDVDINAPASGYYGNTALQAACLFGNEDVARLLIERGADVNAPGGNNGERTALQQACAVGVPSLVTLLIKNGAHVNAPAGRYAGRTALQAAAGGSHIEIAKLLLEAGADVNSKPAKTTGETALAAAASTGNIQLVQLLLDHGADVNVPAIRHKGKTALQAAALQGDLDMVNLLIDSGADVNMPGASFKGGTALHAAAEFGHVDVAERLLTAGADINAGSGWRNQTALQASTVFVFFTWHVLAATWFGRGLKWVTLTEYTCSNGRHHCKSVASSYLGTFLAELSITTGFYPPRTYQTRIASPLELNDHISFLKQILTSRAYCRESHHLAKKPSAFHGGSKAAGRRSEPATNLPTYRTGLGHHTTTTFGRQPGIPPVKMDTLSPELLHDICACLRIEDVLTFRLVCKVFADIGSAHMLPEVSFYMHQGEFARLREIASHPIVSKHVRSLTYFSEVLDSEKMTFPAYVRAHTVENSNGAWNSFFKRHETPNVPQLRAEYHSYELLMKEQQDIIDNHLDVALLKEIIPKFPSLRQATMSSGDWFYEATTKGRFHDANRDDILLRKVRKSPFDDAPDWTGNQLQPEGKRHLNGLIAGLVSSDCHLESFRAGILDWKFFKSFSRVPDHLAKTLKYLKRLEIHIDTEPRQDVQTIHRCRKAMKSGIMRKLIQPLQHLEVLMVTLYPVEWTADEWPAYLGDIIAPGHTWPNLRELCLGGFKTNRHDLMKFLELHKNSLTHLCLRDVGLGETSWWNFLPDIRNKLKLKEACICGDILGLSEDESAEVPDEFWDLSTPGEHPHHKQRQSINAYCRGPDHYPDDVPLSREVVLRHYDACINDPDASCDEEDVFDDDEVDFDGFGHDYFDFYPEDYIGGFDPDEDMDLVEQMIFAGGMLGFGAPAGFSEGFDPDFDEVDDFDGQQPNDDDDDEEIPDLVDPDID